MRAVGERSASPRERTRNRHRRQSFGFHAVSPVAVKADRFRYPGCRNGCAILDNTLGFKGIRDETRGLGHARTSLTGDTAGAPGRNSLGALTFWSRLTPTLSATRRVFPQ